MALLLRGRHFAAMVCIHFTSLEKRVSANQGKVLWTDPLSYDEYFYSKESGLFEDDPAHTHRGRKLADCFKEYENNVSDMLCPSNWIILTQLNSFGRFESDHHQQNSKLGN